MAFPAIERLGPILREADHAVLIGDLTYFGDPPDAFRVVDAILTNFHLPRSSLLVLVAAFAGRELILKSYGHAVRAGYRFYSYGDATLIL